MDATPDFEAWFSARVVADPAAVVSATRLYEDYAAFTRALFPTEQPISRHTLNTRLSERGFWRCPRISTTGGFGGVMRSGARLTNETLPDTLARLLTPRVARLAADPLDLLARIHAHMLAFGALYELNDLADELAVFARRHGLEQGRA